MVFFSDSMMKGAIIIFCLSLSVWAVSGISLYQAKLKLVSLLYWFYHWVIRYHVTQNIDGHGRTVNWYTNSYAPLTKRVNMIMIGFWLNEIVYNAESLSEHALMAWPAINQFLYFLEHIISFLYNEFKTIYHTSRFLGLRHMHLTSPVALFSCAQLWAEPGRLVIRHVTPKRWTSPGWSGCDQSLG